MYLVSYARFHNYDVPFCETTLLTRRNSVYSSCYGGLPECSRLRGEYSPVEKFPVLSGGRSSCLWENSPTKSVSVLWAGTSPRMRGKLAYAVTDPLAVRNIPAHAGKTCRKTGAKSALREHPRARGENKIKSAFEWITDGTSPRTRGKSLMPAPPQPQHRNIPAYAGKIPPQREHQPPVWEHPRARGENMIEVLYQWQKEGTSPRTRGKRHAVG